MPFVKSLVISGFQRKEYIEFQQLLGLNLLLPWNLFLSLLFRLKPKQTEIWPREVGVKVLALKTETFQN